ncbi:hypothetical protein GUJ93_ZPchr0011g28560 [Zizania palustris]|uniref:Disease resistance N-terminal domain-containing protein n=1 Tax=Zizania palustris TaxID=103762 RepID=A0A8J5WHL1_ZIZPA|nr:hypothetical protein GUJ93_ZPchr0011g28560 [Zizania palustris]
MPSARNLRILSQSRVFLLFFCFCSNLTTACKSWHLERRCDLCSAFGGAMEMLMNLPGRLEGLLSSHGSILPKGAEHEIPLIQRDLQEIISILHGRREPQLEGHGHAMRVGCWITEVRELAYDLEDCIDLYEHAAAAGSNTIPRRRNITRRRWSATRSKRIPWISDKLKQRLWMANKIREFSLRTQEALQRHKMCDNLGGITITTAIVDDAPSSSSGSGYHPAPCTEFGHVGIDAAMNKMEEWLTDGEEKRKPDMRRLLIGMLSQIRGASNVLRICYTPLN